MKIARIWSDKLGDTYGIISEDGSQVVSKSDFQEQTGIPIPHSIKEFLFRCWIDKVTNQCITTIFSNKVDKLLLLTPIPATSEIICFAFNYYDHARDAGLAPS